MTIFKSLFSGHNKTFLIVVLYIGAATIILVAVLNVGVPRNGNVVSETDKTDNNSVVEAKEPTEAQTAVMGELSKQVVPEDGFKVNVKWGDVGKKLVASGAIDLTKYAGNYDKEKYQKELIYLTEDISDGITINSDNAYFWVNTLWALGLNQKSLVLDEMERNYPKDLGNLASTGGWTLGAKPAMELYNKETFFPLTDAQQETIKIISANIYRPCCNNSTAFPDCNHGMAALGLIELMVYQNFTEEEIYRAVLAFNSYWFSQSYIDLAYYFRINENTAWADVDAKKVLSAAFSSSSGYASIKKQIGNIPGVGGSGAGCGA